MNISFPRFNSNEDANILIYEDENILNDDIISNIDEVQERVDELQLDLLKSDELDWEKKQDIDKTIKEMENIFNQIEDIQEIVEKIEEEAEKNNLISDELMEKYKPTHFKCDIEGEVYRIFDSWDWKFPECVKEMAVEFHWQDKIISYENGWRSKILDNNFLFF